MRDDLISREAVIEAVDRHTKEDGTLDDDISVILEEVKTAFDKEKVIGQFKNASYWLSLYAPDDDGYIDDYLDSEVIDLDVAIEIIEKGETEWMD